LFEAVGLIAFAQSLSEPLTAARRYIRENGPGIAGAMLLHGLVLLLIFVVAARTGAKLPAPVSKFLNVEVIRLGPETESPPSQVKTAMPQQQATHIPVPESRAPKDIRVAPDRTAQVTDPLEAKLRGLARLHQPNAPLQALDNDAHEYADTTSTDAASGDRALYSLRDFIRAQVERRWILNLSLIGKINFNIPIHLQMTAKGVVTKADIVDQARFKKDSLYRQIALSARNAVLLSSPFALPDGDYSDKMDIVIDLNSRDVLR
jgi:hypothetical protein